MQLAKRYSGIVSVGSMILILVAAHSFDDLVHGLRRNANLDGDLYFRNVLLSMWMTPLLFFVLAICLLVLFWFVIYHGKRNVVISVFFTAVGICILFVPPLSYSGWWFAPVPYFMNWVARDRWFFLGTSALVAAIGVLGIILPRMEDAIKPSNLREGE